MLFHFVKSIREKLKKHVKKENILLKIIRYKLFILDKLKEYKINKSFIDYLNNYWFKKNIREFIILILLQNTKIIIMR